MRLLLTATRALSLAFLCIVGIAVLCVALRCIGVALSKPTNIICMSIPSMTRSQLDADLGPPREVRAASPDGPAQAVYGSGFLTYNVSFLPKDPPSAARVSSATLTIARARPIPLLGAGGITCATPEDALRVLTLAPGPGGWMAYPPYRVSESPTRVDFFLQDFGFARISVIRPRDSGPWQQVVLERFSAP